MEATPTGVWKAASARLDKAISVFPKLLVSLFLVATLSPYLLAMFNWAHETGHWIPIMFVSVFDGYICAPYAPTWENSRLGPVPASAGCVIVYNIKGPIRQPGLDHPPAFTPPNIANIVIGMGGAFFTFVFFYGFIQIASWNRKIPILKEFAILYAMSKIVPSDIDSVIAFGPIFGPIIKVLMGIATSALSFFYIAFAAFCVWAVYTRIDPVMKMIRRLLFGNGTQAQATEAATSGPKAAGFLPDEKKGAFARSADSKAAVKEGGSTRLCAHSMPEDRQKSEAEELWPRFEEFSICYAIYVGLALLAQAIAPRADARIFLIGGSMFWAYWMEYLVALCIFIIYLYRKMIWRLLKEWKPGWFDKNAYS